MHSPKDTQAKENSDVVFECVTTGDPELLVVWRKLEGAIPPDRQVISYVQCSGGCDTP